MFIPSAVYNIEEDIGELLIPVRRSGDVSEELMVICYTQQGNTIFLSVGLNVVSCLASKKHKQATFSTCLEWSLLLI